MPNLASSTVYRLMPVGDTVIHQTALRINASGEKWKLVKARVTPNFYSALGCVQKPRHFHQSRTRKRAGRERGLAARKTRTRIGRVHAQSAVVFSPRQRPRTVRNQSTATENPYPWTAYRQSANSPLPGTNHGQSSTANN